MVKKELTKAGLIKEMELNILKLYNQAFKVVPNNKKLMAFNQQIDKHIELLDKLKNKK